MPAAISGVRIRVGPGLQQDVGDSRVARTHSRVEEIISAAFQHAGCP